MDDPRLVGGGGGGSRSKARLWILVLSYAFDWFILMVGAAIGYVMGEVTPNKRPFSLVNPEIGFPYTVKETIPVWLAIVIAVFGPIVIIAIICLVFVPGSTVPPGTPKSLIWKRKLWELHTAYLGLALSIVAAWLITNGLKNIYGKPRPDLLARCQPDLANIEKYIIRPYVGAPNESSLVLPSICKNTDKHVLDDGFRSFPSGHSSSSASGLIYLTLFIASKFAITIPFFAPGSSADASAFTAFPSRNHVPSSKSTPEAYELQPRGLSDQSSMVADPQKRLASHNKTVAAVRRQAAAPPLYLMLIAIIPLFTSVFIASTRWFDYRHHGFDIIFGFFIGTVTAFFAFRYYHLPISRGAGWAWGPRSPDKAFWAGVGSYSYATDRVPIRAGDEEEALDGRLEGFGHGSGLPTLVTPSSRKGTTTDDRPQDTGYMGATAI